MEPIFAYGTLKNPKVQEEVIGRQVPGTPDHLSGCIKSHFQHSNRKTYPIILSSVKGAGVDGLLFSVTSEELSKIDQYETDFYRREKVTLESGTPAWAYVK